jgi:hypothetical protein
MTTESGIAFYQSMGEEKATGRFNKFIASPRKLSSMQRKITLAS